MMLYQIKLIEIKHTYVHLMKGNTTLPIGGDTSRMLQGIGENVTAHGVASEIVNNVSTAYYGKGELKQMTQSEEDTVRAISSTEIFVLCVCIDGT